jgi:hypothetical protein
MKKIILTLLSLMISLSLLSAADINYKFTNSTVTYSGTGEDKVTYYEFDVLAWLDQTEDLYLQSGMVYVMFNTETFGIELVDNSKV